MGLPRALFVCFQSFQTTTTMGTIVRQTHCSHPNWFTYFNVSQTIHWKKVLNHKILAFLMTAPTIFLLPHLGLRKIGSNVSLSEPQIQSFNCSCCSRQIGHFQHQRSVFKCIDCELTRNDQRNEKEACFGIIVPPFSQLWKEKLNRKSNFYN